MNFHPLLMPFIAVAVLTIATSVSAVEPAREAQLKYLLQQDCGSCHGMTLKGGLGPALLPNNLKDKPDALLVATILDGRAGTAMPPWRSELTEGEAEWLVEQLRRGVE
jgi:cytochrome c55X